MDRKDVKEVKEMKESREEQKQEQAERRWEKKERRGERSVSLLKLNTMCEEQMGQLADNSAKDDATKGATCTHKHTQPYSHM